MSIMHWVGIDDHADKWTIAHFEEGSEKPVREFELMPDTSGYRKLISYVKGLAGEVRIVYEAGPCGYELYRRLTKAGLSCQVAAPSLTPRKPGERVKTNRKDAAKLGRYLRGGQLTFIVIPDQDQESLRDLIRGRSAVQKDLVSVRNQITKFLLRYGHRYREGSAWTGRFWRWLLKIELTGAYSRTMLTEMMVTHEQRQAQLARLDLEIETASRRPEYEAYVTGLAVLRGINTLSAMTILSELGDLRRFRTAPQLMAAVGLVPSESSTGDTSNRYSITKTGNAHVRHIAVEAAWHYQRRATAGAKIRARRKGKDKALVDIAEKCDLRLNRKFFRMTSRGKRSTVAAVAVARELVGFIWALGQIVHP